MKKKKLVRSRSKPHVKNGGKQPPPLMSAEEFADAMNQLGLEVAGKETEKLIGIGMRQCQRFLAGHSAVPDPVAHLLRMYLEHGLPDDVVYDA